MGCPHEMFDNDGVLVTLVLEPQRMSGVIDKLPKALTAIANSRNKV